jgi:hypothetical protein
VVRRSRRDTNRVAFIQVGDQVQPMSLPSRWHALLGGRWREWRTARENLRHECEQAAVVREIESWLVDLLLPDGSVEFYVHVPRLDEVAFGIQYRQQNRELEFARLLSWHLVVPRDELASDVLDELRRSSDDEPILFPLSSYAESSWLNRSGPYD